MPRPARLCDGWYQVHWLIMLRAAWRVHCLCYGLCWSGAQGLPMKRVGRRQSAHSVTKLCVAQGACRPELACPHALLMPPLARTQQPRAQPRAQPHQLPSRGQPRQLSPPLSHVSRLPHLQPRWPPSPLSANQSASQPPQPQPQPHLSQSAAFAPVSAASALVRRHRAPPQLQPPLALPKSQLCLRLYQPPPSLTPFYIACRGRWRWQQTSPGQKLFYFILLLLIRAPPPQDPQSRLIFHSLSQLIQISSPTSLDWQHFFLHHAQWHSSRAQAIHMLLDL